jgi:hypothetical protein
MSYCTDFSVLQVYYGVTRWRIWLRHHATSRKVAGSIPDGYHWNYWHNTSFRTMALGSTQPLTEMRTRNISWGVKRSVLRADNFTMFMCRLSCNLGASNSWKPLGLKWSCTGIAFPLPLQVYHYICCSISLLLIIFYVFKLVRKTSTSAVVSMPVTIDSTTTAIQNKLTCL